jgi:hypothetical protein
MAEAVVVVLKILTHYQLDPLQASTLFRVHGGVEGAAGLALLLKPELLAASPDRIVRFVVRMWATAILAIGVCSTGIGASRDCSSAAARSFGFAMVVFHALSSLMIIWGVLERTIDSRWLCMLFVHPFLAYLFFAVVTTKSARNKR